MMGPTAGRARPGDAPPARPGDAPEAAQEFLPGPPPETAPGILPEATPETAQEATADAAPGILPTVTADATPAITPDATDLPEGTRTGPWTEGSDRGPVPPFPTDELRARLASDPRKSMWIRRAVASAAAGIIVSALADWRLGLTAAAGIPVARTNPP